MAKETVTVDNGLEELKLKNSKEMEKKDKKIKTKEKKEKKQNKEKNGFIANVKSELKLVTWPSKKSVFKYSFASIMMIVLMAGFFLGLSALFDLLYGLVQGWIG